MKTPVLKIVRLPHGQHLPLPAYQTKGAAGLDLHLADKEGVYLLPGEWKLVPTGIKISVPPGYEGTVRPRSGLALNKGITVLNTPGTIDSDYRGEVKVILINLGTTAQLLDAYSRIAQLVISPVTTVEMEECESLDDTDRNTQGFGSTGVLPNPK